MPRFAFWVSQYADLMYKLNVCNNCGAHFSVGKIIYWGTILGNGQVDFTGWANALPPWSHYVRNLVQQFHTYTHTYINFFLLFLIIKFQGALIQWDLLYKRTYYSTIGHLMPQTYFTENEQIYDTCNVTYWEKSVIWGAFWTWWQWMPQEYALVVYPTNGGCPIPANCPSFGGPSLFLKQKRECFYHVSHSLQKFKYSNVQEI